MLKRYETPERLQWVGRAWEIRRALRQEMNSRGGKTKLADMLPARTSRGPDEPVKNRRKGAILRFPAP